MLTVSLHPNESVFVYLNGTKKEKKSIQQLGMVDLDFSFSTRFLYEDGSREKLSSLFKDLLQALNKENEEIYVSIPAEMVLLSLYEDIPRSKVQETVDQDVWLTEKKMGDDYIRQSDCQVKVVYDNDKAALTAVYFPKIVSRLFQDVCSDCGCTLTGIGINVINVTNILERSPGKTDYYLMNYTDNGYELLKISKKHITGYMHFLRDGNDINILNRAGSLDEEECMMILDKRYAGKKILDRPVFCFGESSQLSQIRELMRRNTLVEMLKPVRDTECYGIDDIKYDQSYDAVFASALGVLF